MVYILCDHLAGDEVYYWGPNTSPKIMYRHREKERECLFSNFCNMFAMKKKKRLYESTTLLFSQHWYAHRAHKDTCIPGVSRNLNHALKTVTSWAKSTINIMFKCPEQLRMFLEV